MYGAHRLFLDGLYDDEPVYQYLFVPRYPDTDCSWEFGMCICDSHSLLILAWLGISIKQRAFRRCDSMLLLIFIQMN